MTKPLRCRFGRHRWFSVGMSDNGAIIWRCQACGKTTKRGNTPDFPGDIVP